MGALLSEVAKRKKLAVLTQAAKPSDRILEIGAGSGWLGQALTGNGFTHYESCDLEGSATFIGDIRQWKSMGLVPSTYDWVVAFEVVEHVDCLDAIWDLLKPGGKVFLTSPVPHFDWVCRVLETVGFAQKRTSPHDHLLYFESIPRFRAIWRKNVAGIAQWGIFEKPSLGEAHV
jgi:SAM-dependent methyltransferase